MNYSYSTPLAFPSRHFPSADLRLSDDTTYEWQCPACDMPITVQFTQQLNDEKGILIECPDCGAGYRLKIDLVESSSEAYRLRVLGVELVTKSAPSTGP